MSLEVEVGLDSQGRDTSGQINFVLQKISRSETIARLKPIGEKVRMIQI